MLYSNYFKRVFDVIISLVAFIILLPVFLLVCAILVIANNGSPFFIQPRPGLHEKIFNVIKFKTMNDKKDKSGNLLSDAKRLTAVGKFIRRTSLDEIPQLINVIKGDMSLVGPRPLLIRYLPYFTAEEKLRFSVTPGITGLAQISGRNLLNWDKRLALDVEYVKNQSFILDYKIILKTVYNVFASKNIVIDPESIMQNLDDERKNSYITT